MLAKHLPCGYALEYPYNFSYQHLRMRATQQMDVISIHPHPLNLNCVPLSDPFARLYNNLYHLRIQQGLPILNRKNNVVVYLPHTVITSINGACFFHTDILQNLSPCGKPQGIGKLNYGLTIWGTGIIGDYLLIAADNGIWRRPLAEIVYFNPNLSNINAQTILACTKLSQPVQPDDSDQLSIAGEHSRDIESV